MSVRSCVLCHGWLCKASHPCIRICLLGSVGLPVPRSSASPLPLMWVSGAGLIVSLYFQNTVDCLRKWAQWLWCPYSRILMGTPFGSSQLHELRWGLRASALCTHWDRHTHGATHIYRSAFYKSMDHPAFSRDACLNSNLCCLLATWLWARCLSLLFAPPLASVLSPIKGNNTAHLTLLLWGLTELTSVQCSDGHLVPGKDCIFVNAFKELASLLMPYTHT